MNDIYFFNIPLVHLRFVSHFAIEKIAQILQEKGMNVEAAYERAKALFSHELEKADLYLHNLHKFFDQTEREKMYHYLAKRALFGQSMDFHSYDQLLALRQSIRQGALSEEELNTLQKVSQANRFGVIVPS